MSTSDAIASIEATSTLATAAVRRANREVAVAVSSGPPCEPQHLADLIRKRELADENAQKISTLLLDVKTGKYRIDQMKELQRVGGE